MTEAGRGHCLWIVSEDEDLRQRAEVEVKGRGSRVRVVPQKELDSLSWKEVPHYPGAILLDVANRLDWATTVMRQLKRARVPSPVIVVTANPTREFGIKIVSLGFSYFLPRDFAPGELGEVFSSLVGAPKQQSESEGPGA